ncbi:hypothetical protein OHS18_14240 [Amycolatopsis sp. NBC_00355]|uniref:hypothetical protein n=1 Tax=Amycolatopsis sp. NBC_00355 TaxID=2975957 RepID=UPI002E276624
MRRRVLLIVVGWLVAAGATAAVATFALDVVGAGILGPQNQPLSQDDVTRALAAAPAPVTTSAPAAAASSSTTSSSAASPSTPAPRGLTVPGGSIVAECAGGQVTLRSWSPDPGYRTDDVSRGPAASASIKFKNGGTENVVVVTCTGDEPHAETVADDHHGGRGNG